MDEEMDNFETYKVFENVAEDSLESWDAKKRRAAEVIDMMWVLKKKYNEMRELLKYKARGTVREYNLHTDKGPTTVRDGRGGHGSPDQRLA